MAVKATVTVAGAINEKEAVASGIGYCIINCYYGKDMKMKKLIPILLFLFVGMTCFASGWEYINDDILSHIISPYLIYSGTGTCSDNNSSDIPFSYSIEINFNSISFEITVNGEKLKKTGDKTYRVSDDIANFFDGSYDEYVVKVKTTEERIHSYDAYLEYDGTVELGKLRDSYDKSYQYLGSDSSILETLLTDKHLKIVLIKKDEKQTTFNIGTISGLSETLLRQLYVENRFFVEDETYYNRNYRLSIIPSGVEWSSFNVDFSGVKHVSAFCFFDSEIGDVVLPDSIVTIGRDAFAFCDNITSFVFSSNLGTIPESVLDYCENLTEITIPKSVTKIESEAFSYCSALSIVNYLGTEAEFKLIEKGKNWDLRTGNYTVVCSDGVLDKIEAEGTSADDKWWL